MFTRGFFFPLLYAAFLATILVDPVRAQATGHPLDSMSWQEYWSVLDVLQKEGHLDKDTRFSIVTLQEPGKKSVLSWSPGDPVSRSAFAVVRQEERSFEAVIDLIGVRLVSWKELQGVQPSWIGEEWESVNDDVMENPDFVAAMKRRGFEDLSLLDCGAGPPGYFGTEEHKGRRVAHFGCRYGNGVRNNWNRGIEGLVVVVDMNTHEVLRVVDEGVVPVPTESADYDRASTGPARQVPGPIFVSQPMGSGFKLAGQNVEWQNWNFHLRSDQRVGVVISLVSYQDGNDRRSVLYQGFLSEIFVPYMDPSFGWFARNFLDLGEYNAGGLTSSLMRGVDCPDHAHFLNALISDDNGRPVSKPDMVCIFEREAGDMSWRHATSPEDGGPEGRKRRDLVVRSAAVLGNYDYVFDWVFRQDGSMTVAVGATGIVEVKAVAEASTDDKPLGEVAADDYGRFVDPHVVAVNHDHYFSFRLDLDVDGTENSLLVDHLETKMLPEGHPRRSIWISNPEIAAREADAKMKINYDRPALWRVISSTRKNHVGYPTSYQLTPGVTANSLMTPDDYPQRRAGFIDHHLWVTPYRADERYAAGDYPTLSTPGQGLPAWTEENRKIRETDIVLWYTVGMHHMVRAEDWPVMPVMWHSFQLRPFDYFDENPAMDLPD